MSKQFRIVVVILKQFFWKQSEKWRKILHFEIVTPLRKDPFQFLIYFNDP